MPRVFTITGIYVCTGYTFRFFGAERVEVWVCDLATSCCAAKLLLAVKYCFWLVMFYPIKICSYILCLYRGHWYTKQLLALNPLISNPYLHPFRTEEVKYQSES